MVQLDSARVACVQNFNFKTRGVSIKPHIGHGNVWLIEFSNLEFIWDLGNGICYFYEGLYGNKFAA